jgi:hypothetical protein
MPRNFSSRKCNFGVPQGSIIGPLLFLLTFNDIESVLHHSKIITYADDTIIYLPGKTTEDIQIKLQEDFNSVAEWLESMDLVSNMKKGKTEVMLFGTTQKTKNNSLSIQYRFKKLSATTSYKYLGVKLDQSLSLREHINSVYKKASARLYLLKRIRPQLTTDAALTLYKTMLLPIFTYCSILTSTYTETLEKKIVSFEKRADAIIFRNPHIHNKKKLSIRNLQKRRVCVQVFNCINGNVCVNLKNYFEVMSNNTRNANKLIRLPRMRLESSKKSFKFTGAKEYNKLPIKVRNATSTKKI